jgi:hypothetical protein
MKIGKAQGVMILLAGLVLLTAAILVLVTLPSWGNWVGDYPAQATQNIAQNAPEQARPVAQSVLSFVLGPVFEQVGGYMKIAGYFVGSLMLLGAISASAAGTMIIRKA